MVEDYLLYHLLEYEKEVPANTELFEINFKTVRYLRKEASYEKKYTREEELEPFKNRNVWNACTSFITLQKYSKRKRFSLESREK